MSRFERSYTYLIFCKSENIYKIGKSGNPDQRLENLKSSEKLADLTLFHKISCYDMDQAYEIEYLLHHIYRDKRIRGEWFALGSSDIKALMKIHTASVAIYTFLPSWYSDIKAQPEDTRTLREKEMIERYKVILESPLHPVDALRKRRNELESEIPNLEKRLAIMHKETSRINNLLQRLLGS